MKKLLCVLLVFALAVGTFAGCKTSTTQPETTDAAVETETAAATDATAPESGDDTP